MKKLLLLLILSLISSAVYGADSFEWKNDLRTKFLNNEAIIMEINMRSFNSVD